LLPYQENTFAFGSDRAFGMLLKALLPSQSQAIRQITLRSPQERSSAFNTLLANRLSGVRQLTCFADMPYRCSAEQLRQASVKDPVGLKTAALLQYERLSILSIYAAAYDTDHSAITRETAESLGRRHQETAVDSVGPGGIREVHR